VLAPKRDNIEILEVIDRGQPESYGSDPVSWVTVGGGAPGDRPLMPDAES
jgi:hypothetical protein